MRDAPGLAKDDKHGSLPPLLIVLTVVTGIVDAVSYLRLGHVFVANMTGNVVFLGFGLAGAGDVAAAASLAALLAFALGGLIGARVGVRFGAHRVRVLAGAILVKVIIISVAAAVAAFTAGHFSEPVRFLLVGLLATTMGLQNAAARRVAVPDLTTTVLTMTITGLVADSPLGGGNGIGTSRRLVAICAMLIGAAIGGVLVHNVSVTAALGAAALLLAASGLLAFRASASGAPGAQRAAIETAP